MNYNKLQYLEDYLKVTNENITNLKNKLEYIGNSNFLNKHIDYDKIKIRLYRMEILYNKLFIEWYELQK